MRRLLAILAAARDMIREEHADTGPADAALLRLHAENLHLRQRAETAEALLVRRQARTRTAPAARKGAATRMHRREDDALWREMVGF